MSTVTESTPSRPPPLSEIELAKHAAAQRAVKDHFDPTARYVGIGSGSTIVYVVEAIQALSDPRIHNINFVPTGYQSRQVILRAGLKDFQYNSIPDGTLIDIAFDGADEIDNDLNCIKGGGACLYQEKLVATRARRFICVADHRKLQPRLLTKWKYIPVEVEPLANRDVMMALKELGATSTVLREGHMQKAGPVKTDQDNFIIDAGFKPLLLSTNVESGGGEDGVWAPQELAKAIKAIEGVLSVGLFVGENGLQTEKRGLRKGGQKPVAAYFGMEDGSVKIRHMNESGNVEEI